MTTATEVRRRHFNSYTLLVVFAISLTSLGYGYTGAVIGTISGQPSFFKYMGLDTAPNATQLLGAINAMYYVGGVLGTFYAGYAADRWGRRNASVQAQIILAISSALQAGSVHIAMFIVSRFICGFGGYTVLCVTPMWLAELVPPGQRGMLMEIATVLMILGYFTASWVGYGFFFYSGSIPAFRPILAFGCIVPIIFVCISYWTVESPRWLISRGRHEEAHNLLKSLHKNPHDLHDSFAEAEYYQIRRQAELDSALDLSYKGMFATRPMTKRTVMAIIWPFMTATSGILVIFNYGPLLYESLGYSAEKQVLYQAGWTTLNWAANICGCLFVDLFQRPTYAAIGLFGCMACLCVEAAMVATSQTSPTQAILECGVAMIFLYGVAYGAFLDGLLFVYVGEIFPTPYRAKGYNIALATQALSNIAWTGAAPTAFAEIGWRYYLPFIILSAINVVIICIWFPNTRHLALEEVAAIFGDGDRVAVYQSQIQGTNLVNIESDQPAGSKANSVSAEHKDYVTTEVEGPV
ncbi:uncharacterized protein A1O5_01346 [Cladophialophora psammophila CBS 110553]|uniref:Major facilitator superfamily (MFS) profile domain-containing protein n=1 Tax=Cladophialophora psammophila CBS 110553 TaxID=1182543 RepID=W9X363_9EURO|nr:uncharacterized protein A1O5_01346 [Cladophialophora psammophila CBS 110553]EXJ74653.1 hypothetical protein A1O5_01346 [Cladophialophora psammophila CBS 110553]